MARKVHGVVLFEYNELESGQEVAGTAVLLPLRARLEYNIVISLSIDLDLSSLYNNYQLKMLMIYIVTSVLMEQTVVLKL